MQKIQLSYHTNENHYTDWSSLLDAPAGKHGRVETKADKFVFENGSEVRFWGVNLVGSDCFPNEEDAEKLADRLSRMGCNLVRFHHMDADWAEPNIFYGSASLSLSEESLQRLDYLFYQLKLKGVYVFFDLLVHRKFGRIEGFEEGEVVVGAKQSAFFDDRVLELQKEFISQLLGHKNQYTEFMYSQDPALVGCMIINEASILGTTTGDQLSEGQRKLISKLPKFEVDYTVPGGKFKSDDVYNQLDVTGLIEKERLYFIEYKRFLNQKIGFKGLVIGSNFPLPISTMLYTNQEMDSIAVNAYWDHPQLDHVCFDWSQVEKAPINNKSQIKRSDYFFNNLVQLVSRFKVKDKPLLVTEWNACNPNDFMSESVLFFAAYARQQGWNGACQFSFEKPFEEEHKFSSFSISHRPDVMAQWAIAAPLFLGDYLEEFQEEATFYFSKEEIYKLKFNDFIDQFPLLPFHKKVNYAISEQSMDDLEKGLPLAKNSPLIIDFDRGLMQIRTEKVQGLMGFWSGQEFDFPMFKVETQNEYCSLMLLAKDEKPLTESQDIILVAVTKGKEDREESVFEAEELAISILFKHEIKSKKIWVKPIDINGTNDRNYFEMKLEEKGMRLNLNDQIRDQNGDLISSTFVFSVKIEY